MNLHCCIMPPSLCLTFLLLAAVEGQFSSGDFSQDFSSRRSPGNSFTPEDQRFRPQSEDRFRSAFFSDPSPPFHNNRHIGHDPNGFTSGRPISESQWDPKGFPNRASAFQSPPELSTGSFPSNRFPVNAREKSFDLFEPFENERTNGIRFSNNFPPSRTLDPFFERDPNPGRVSGFRNDKSDQNTPNNRNLSPPFGGNFPPRTSGNSVDPQRSSFFDASERGPPFENSFFDSFPASPNSRGPQGPSHSSDKSRLPPGINVQSQPETVDKSFSNGNSFQSRPTPPPVNPPPRSEPTNFRRVSPNRQIIPTSKHTVRPEPQFRRISSFNDFNAPVREDTEDKRFRSPFPPINDLSGDSNPNPFSQESASRKEIVSKDVNAIKTSSEAPAVPHTSETIIEDPEQPDRETSSGEITRDVLFSPIRSPSDANEDKPITTPPVEATMNEDKAKPVVNQQAPSPNTDNDIYPENEYDYEYEEYADEISDNSAQEEERPKTETIKEPEAPVAKVSETPLTKVSETPVEKVSETPLTKVFETPVEKVSETPVTKVSETPDDMGESEKQQVEKILQDNSPSPVKTVLGNLLSSTDEESAPDHKHIKRASQEEYYDYADYYYEEEENPDSEDTAQQPSKQNEPPKSEPTVDPTDVLAKLKQNKERGNIFSVLSQRKPGAGLSSKKDSSRAGNLPSSNIQPPTVSNTQGSQNRFSLDRNRPRTPPFLPKSNTRDDSEDVVISSAETTTRSSRFTPSKFRPTSRFTPSKSSSPKQLFITTTERAESTTKRRFGARPSLFNRPASNKNTNPLLANKGVEKDSEGSEEEDPIEKVEDLIGDDHPSTDNAPSQTEQEESSDLTVLDNISTEVSVQTLKSVEVGSGEEFHSGMTIPHTSDPESEGTISITNVTDGLTSVKSPSISVEQLLDDIAKFGDSNIPEEDNPDPAAPPLTDQLEQGSQAEDSHVDSSDSSRSTHTGKSLEFDDESPEDYGYDEELYGDYRDVSFEDDQDYVLKTEDEKPQAIAPPPEKPQESPEAEFVTLHPSQFIFPPGFNLGDFLKSKQEEKNSPVPEDQAAEDNDQPPKDTDSIQSFEGLNTTLQGTEVSTGGHDNGRVDPLNIRDEKTSSSEERNTSEAIVPTQGDQQLEDELILKLNGDGEPVDQKADDKLESVNTDGASIKLDDETLTNPSKVTPTSPPEVTSTSFSEVTPISPVEVASTSPPEVISTNTPEVTSNKPLEITSSKQEEGSSTENPLIKTITNEEVPLDLLPPGFKLPFTKPPSTTTTAPVSTTAATTSQPTLSDQQAQEVKTLLGLINYDDLKQILPPGYKITDNSKTTVETTTTRTTPSGRPNPRTTHDDVSAFLPPGFNFETFTAEPTSPRTTRRPKNDFRTTHDDISQFLPPGFKLEEIVPKSTTPRSKSDIRTTHDDISAFLPPDFSLSTSSESEKTTQGSKSTTAKSVNYRTTHDDISAFLPPGFTFNEPGKELDEIKDESGIKFVPIGKIDSLLPPGYDLASANKKDSNQDTTESSTDPKSKIVKPKSFDSLFKNVQTKNLLPQNYPLETTTHKFSAALATAEDEEDITKFLPKGFPLPDKTTPVPAVEVKTTPSDAIDKLSEILSQVGVNGITGLLPSGIEINTTPSPTTKKPTLVFPTRKGPPMRPSQEATTEENPKASPPPPPEIAIRTGWPKRPAEPFVPKVTAPPVVQKVTEAVTEAVTTTTTPSTTTTTTMRTTTTLPTRPTTPGLCGDFCRLAATLKITKGTEWKPELLDRNTRQWQDLAILVEKELDHVYRNSILADWYDGVHIDGFSPGSVLVDYFIKFKEINRRIDTQDLKEYFNQNLPRNDGELKLGTLTVDPQYTDFIVLQEPVTTETPFVSTQVVPEWGIAVIVVGLASVLFVLVFGVTVIILRRRSSKKRAHVPLTEEMLNDLNKDHMGGFDNYNGPKYIENYSPRSDWEDPYSRKPTKGKMFHAHSQPQIFDSWRTDWNKPYTKSTLGGYGRRIDTEF